MSGIPYHRIAQQFYNRPLLLLPQAAQTISAFLLSRMAGGGSSANDDSAETIEAFRPTETNSGVREFHSARASRFHGQTPLDENGRPLPFRRTQDGTAIITLVGEFVNRGAWIGASSGLISYEGLKAQVAMAARDPNTKAIVLDIESPGGEAVGCFEASDVVREAAKSKPVIAVANGYAASAAYSIASAASRVVVPPTGVLGSIGVVSLHLDFSQFLENEGVKPTFIFAGAHKVDGNPYEALPESVRADWQLQVESFYAQFVSTVAAGRKGLSEDRIRATEARMFKGQDAVSAGLADSVGTFEEVLADLSRGHSGRTPTSTMKGSTMDNSNGAPAATVAGNAPVAEVLAAFPAQTAEIAATAATAERERILGIGALADSGNAEMILQMQKDGKTTPAEAALRILNAQRQTRSQQLQAVKDVEAAANGVAPAPAAQAAPSAPSKATGAEGWKEEWSRSDALKAEFETADTYVAYQTGVTSGRIKRLDSRKSA